MKKPHDFFVDALHIFLLFSLALVQPLFDLLSRNAEFFVVRRSEPVDVIFLILILCILIPTLVVLVELVAGLFGRRVRKGMHGFVVAGLVAAIVLPALKQIGGIPGTAVLLGAAILGVGAAISYVRFHPVRMFLTVLSPALLIFPSLFVFNSSVSKVVFLGDDSKAVYPKVDATAPVVIVVFDELLVTLLMDEKRQIDPIRYPNFAALARDATWFRNATTVGENTVIAVPAILTGNYPDPALLPTATDHPNNIFTLLGGSYDLKVFGTITRLCPDQLCGRTRESSARRMSSLLSDLSIVYLHILLPTDLSAGLPSITQNWMDFAADEGQAKNNAKSKVFPRKTFNALILHHLQKDRSRQFMEFVDAIDSTKEPTLYFLDILLPHLPYKYLPSGKTYGTYGGAREVSEKYSSDEWAVIQYYQLHLLQVGFVDTLLGKLLARLKAVGLYHRSLIVVTSDHGVSFRPNDFRRAVTKTNFQDIMPVPLFIKAPNQHQGVISDRNVETIDIFPTIAGILGVKLPWSVDGRSAFDLSLPERKKKVIFYKQAKERLVFDCAALEARYLTLERKLALFGSGENPDGLFKIGPHSSLVGRHVSEVGVAGEASVVIELDGSTLFDDVDPGSAFVPAQITGSLRGSRNTGAQRNLAVAVNGTIRAVTRTYPVDTGLWEWAAMVPEASFRPGQNDVEVFIVSVTEGSPRLVRTINQLAITYSLAGSGRQGGETITSLEGSSIPVIPGAMQGWLDVSVVDHDRVKFAGWAADVKNSELPKAILIFANGEFLHSGRTKVDRPDVVKAYGNPALQRAGFIFVFPKFVFPKSVFKDIPDAEVRFFAQSKHGVASELNYHEGYRWRKKL